MKLFILLSLIFSANTFAMEEETALFPFSTDGCSMYPNQNFHGDWLHCCIAHDIKFWYGGTKAEKKKADKELSQCVSNATNRAHGEIMRAGVTIGGNPSHLKLPWEWGYGWYISKKFDRLTPELATVVLFEIDSVMNYIKSLPSKIVGKDGLSEKQLQYIKEKIEENKVFLKKRITGK